MGCRSGSSTFLRKSLTCTPDTPSNQPHSLCASHCSQAHTDLITMTLCRLVHINNHELIASSRNPYPPRNKTGRLAPRATASQCAVFTSDLHIHNPLMRAKRHPEKGGGTRGVPRRRSVTRHLPRERSVLYQDFLDHPCQSTQGTRCPEEKQEVEKMMWDHDNIVSD
jgi:hypothetical protein